MMVKQRNRARFLSNIEYMRENYEDLHGMKMGKDVKVVAVANSSGALLMTTHHPAWMRDKADVNDPDCPMKMVAGKTCSNPSLSQDFRRGQVLFNSALPDLINY
jgi:hypothetical protein